ncbi:MAG: hypothetical protein HY289_05235 [Planctomycetes bacterium]|nr:hypothetical protein [Planctomycetota bacterium]
MFFTRCPACQANVEFSDESAAAVFCKACDHKIELRESAQEREKRVKKARKEEVKKLRALKPTQNIWVELAPLMVAVPFGLLFALITCIFPPFVVMTVVTGMLTSIVGLVLGCYRASYDGNWIGFDYLGVLAACAGALMPIFIALHVILLPIALMLWLLHIQGYIILWQVALIGCAIKQPRPYMPSLGMEAFGFAVIAIGIVCAFIGGAIHTAIWG